MKQIYSLMLACLLLWPPCMVAQNGQVQQFNVPLPPAVAFYDFDSSGEKGFVSCFENGNALYFSTLYFHNGFSSTFAPSGISVPIPAAGFTYGSSETYVTGIDDVNGDGIPDVGAFASEPNGNYQWAIISNGAGQYDVREMVIFNNYDFNRDGRTDMVQEISNRGNTYTMLHNFTHSGTLLSQQMQLVAYEEYQGDFDAASWMEMQEASAVNKQLGNNPWSILTGAALAPSSAPTPLSVPDMTLDLNGDGYADLIESATGTIYYGTPEGKYVVSTVGGAARVRDLNGDGIADYVVYGGEEGVVRTMVYRGSGEFEVNTLIDNLAADSPVWCYDFDRDGDVDILVTFSAYNTDGQTSYTLFFENDGNGNFTSHEDYVDKNYIYSTCRDIDNDGYYDLLLLEYDDSHKENWQTISTYNVMVRRGGAEFTLGDAELLYAFETNNNIIDFPDVIDKYTVEAEDIDNDGKIEIWVSHKHIAKFFDSATNLFSVDGAPNTAPTAPALPTVNYNASTGNLQLSWGAATDAESSSNDLTYAVRIGSIPGGCDMVYAHALADGTRRNFIDGNAGSNREMSLDLRSWPMGTYYVSVQAVDPNHAGSAWSEEASFEHTYLPVDYTLTDYIVPTVRPLEIHYTVSNGITHNWDLNGGEIVSDNAGTLSVRWTQAGEKEIVHTVTAANGTQATLRQSVTVVDNWLGLGPNTFYRNYDPQFFDYDNDGLVDFAASTQFDGNGLFHNDGNGVFSKARGIFNQGLEFTECTWLDFNRDGNADMLYYDYSSGKFGVLLNNGGGSFTKQSDIDINIDELLYGAKADMNNDGLVDFLTDSSKGAIYINRGNGNFETLQNTDDWRSHVNIFDWDGDGLLDNYDVYNDGYDYTMLRVFRNCGNFNFELIEVPFETPVPRTDFAKPAIVDFDNDGYYDLIYWGPDGNIEVLKNEGNTKLVPTYSIATGLTTTQKKNYEGSYCNYSIFDLDNNGYEDILITSYDATRQDSLAVYAVYVDAPGHYRQGFISDATGSNRALLATALQSGQAPMVLSSQDPEETLIDNRTLVTNTRPLPPTTVVARQTESSLHITWSTATDAETPTTKLRYNLSVKKLGATGADSYIISPLNGGSNSTGPYSGRQTFSTNETYNNSIFNRATQFDIPIDCLPVGEYEIQVQTIDLWGEASDFSAPITVKINASPLISAPTMLPVGQTAIIEYVGARDESTEPVWDFDGGNIIEGNSYGPYKVSWNDFGNKTVSVTVGAEHAEVTVAVTRWYDVIIGVPQEVYFNSEFDISMSEIPRNAILRWELSGETVPGEDFEIDASAGEPSAKARIIGHPELAQRKLTLYATIDGFTHVRSRDITVLPEIEAPSIELVASEGNHNVVTWNAASLPATCNQVIVYKEGAVFNDFVEIGRVEKQAGRFVDLTADNTTHSERYAIAMTLSSGETSRIGTPHQTVLLTINRGIAEGTYNLIWNRYEGREIASYRIMRGTSPDALQEIAVLPGSATNFVDMTPGGIPYYALEILPAAPVSASGITTKDATTGASTRSNVVYAGNAATINYVSELRIVSLQGNTSLTQEEPFAYLYAEILPLSSTYQRVEWSITEGTELATVNDYGVVTALSNSTGGYATVTARTTDGSDIEATLQLWVDPLESGIENVTDDVTITLRTYPQPVDDVLYLSSSSEIVQIHLYDSRGTVVRGITQRGVSQIEVGDLPAGLYILHVTMSEGNQAVEKILKK